MKILVVDDHPLVREGLAQVLLCLGQDTQVLQAETCTQALELSRTHPDLDLILLDYNLPDMTGIEVLEIFRHESPEMPVLMLSGSASIQTMRQVLSLGAAGFVTKSSRSEELLAAVQLVLGGGIYVPAEVDLARQVLGNRNEEPTQLLTRRQMLVLRGLVNGYSNKHIGQTLELSEETVKCHVTAILRHFNVRNRTQAVVAAGKLGITPSTFASGSIAFAVNTGSTG